MGGTAGATHGQGMDSDGFDHKYVTGGGAIVLTPRLSPKAARLAYVSFAGGQPGIRLLDLNTGNERPLLSAGGISFAPRFSPDGSRIVFSMMNGTNADIYVASASGGIPQRLTTSPGRSIRCWRIFSGMPRNRMVVPCLLSFPRALSKLNGPNSINAPD